LEQAASRGREGALDGGGGGCFGEGNQERKGFQFFSASDLDHPTDIPHSGIRQALAHFAQS